MGCASSAAPASPTSFAATHRTKSINMQTVQSALDEHYPVAKKLSPRSNGFSSKYDIVSKIGCGNQAQVYLASRSAQKSDVAVKVRNLHHGTDISRRSQQFCKSAHKEICIWNRVGKHANCVHLQESFFDDHLCYMVMERCSQSLPCYLDSLPSLTENTLAPVFAQMLQGIAHVHAAGIIHRDVKGDNFIIGGADRKTIKLTDFGLSQNVPEHSEIVVGVAGTPAYMCPEMFLQGCCSVKADVWSFGVVAHLLLCGTFPYTGDGSRAAMRTAIIEGAAPICDRTWLSTTAVSFLHTLLDRDPQTRPTAAEVLKMPFIADHSTRNTAVSLHHILHTAITSGGFVEEVPVKPCDVDFLLNSILKGRLESGDTRVLTDAQMDEFLGANEDDRVYIVDVFWTSVPASPKAKAAKQQGPSCASTPSTTCSWSEDMDEATIASSC